MKTQNTEIIAQNKVFLRIATGTGLLLSIPLVARQFTGEVNWDLADFIVMGTLLFGTGSMFVLLARVISRRYRFLLEIGILMVVLWLWVELAVGLFTNWGS